MIVKVAWSSVYLQLSSFNFLMSGLFGDILCLRFFLSGAYLWLFVNAVAGFPNWNELYNHHVFILHIDVLIWSTVTLYVHSSKLIGLLRNEAKVTNLPKESLPLWRMLYRNGGLSELLFQQFVWPRFSLVSFKEGEHIPEDDAMYIVLDGMAQATIKVKGKSERTILLRSGEVIHVKHLHLFQQAKCEAFAEQTVHATCISNQITLYKCKCSDMESIAKQPQTKQAYQGLLIFVLTRIAERAILQEEQFVAGQQSGQSSFASEATSIKSVVSHIDSKEDIEEKIGRNPAFWPLEEWEEPDPLVSGSGKALTMPVAHFAASLKKSFRPPWPIIRWIPGLRHAALPAPYHRVEAMTASSSSLSFKTDSEQSDTTFKNDIESSGSLKAEHISGETQPLLQK